MDEVTGHSSSNMRMIAELSLTVNGLQKKLSEMDSFLGNFSANIQQALSVIGQRFDKAEARLTALEPAKIVEETKEVSSDAANSKGVQDNVSNG